MRRTLCVVGFLVLLLTATARGQEHVLIVPTEYPTIQDALNEASGLSGDVLIEVGPGTYEGNLDLNSINNPDHRVTLHALQGQSQTVIEAAPPEHK